MARRNRDLSTSTWFHVFNRGVDRQDIFSGDRDWQLFEVLLAEALDRHRVELHAYALMSNHFHLLVHCPNDGLSDMMRRMCGRYGAAYNERIGREGHVFTSRFESVPITSDGQLEHVARYIHRNPLAFVPVEALAAYRWSSLSAVCGRRTVPPWLSRGQVAVGDAERYLRYVIEPQPSDRDLGRCRGSSVGCADVVRAVVARCRCGVSEVREGKRGATRTERMLAVSIALELRCGSSAQIGEYFHADSRTVRRLASQGRALATTDRAAGALRRALLADLLARPERVA